MQELRPRSHRWLLLLPLLAGIVLVGCTAVRRVAARYPRSDLDAIYEGARGVDRNPVILIPGFGGSALVRAWDDQQVWGAFFRKDSLGYGKREGLRAFALDVDRLAGPIDHRSLAHVDDDTHAVGLLRILEADTGIADLNIRVYAALVEMLDDAGYLPGNDGIITNGRPEAPRFFSFFYDWRQDNATNAVELARFVDECREKVEKLRRDAGLSGPPVKFDIVAHSMGGLIARYYLRYGGVDVLDDPEPQITWEGAANVDRAILVSTPNFGLMKALRNMVHGHKPPVLPRIHAALAATLVSVYQIFPRERHALWIDENGEPTTVEFMSSEPWMKNGWGPFAPKQEKYLEWLFPALDTNEARRRRMAEMMDAAFERSRRFNDALDRHPPTPPPCKLVLFAGDAEPTLTRGLVRRRNGVVELEFDGRKSLSGPGDGTVTRASAQGDERLGDNGGGPLTSPVPWSWTVFLSARHTSLLGNPTFQNNLLHILVEQAPDRAAPATLSGVD